MAAAIAQADFWLIHGMTNVLAGRRILIAEDESVIALDLEIALQELGCEVVGPVSRLDDVMRLVEADSSIDGALLDVNLRGEQIFSVLPQIMASKLPIIITSGYDDATLFPPEFRGLPRVSKPFDAANLRQLCLSVFSRN